MADNSQSDGAGETLSQLPANADDEALQLPEGLDESDRQRLTSLRLVLSAALPRYVARVESISQRLQELRPDDNADVQEARRLWDEMHFLRTRALYFSQQLGGHIRWTDSDGLHGRRVCDLIGFAWEPGDYLHDANCVLDDYTSFLTVASRLHGIIGPGAKITPEAAKQLDFATRVGLPRRPTNPVSAAEATTHPPHSGSRVRGEPQEPESTETRGETEHAIVPGSQLDLAMAQLANGPNIVPRTNDHAARVEIVRVAVAYARKCINDEMTLPLWEHRYQHFVDVYLLAPWQACFPDEAPLQLAKVTLAWEAIAACEQVLSALERIAPRQFASPPSRQASDAETSPPTVPDAAGRPGSGSMEMPPISRADLPCIIESIHELLRVVEQPPVSPWVAPEWFIRQYAATTTGTAPASPNHACLIQAAAVEVLHIISPAQGSAGPVWYHKNADCPEINDSLLDLRHKVALTELRESLLQDFFATEIAANGSDRVKFLGFLEEILDRLNPSSDKSEVVQARAAHDRQAESGRLESAPKQFVTLGQMAALVNRSKKTLERMLNEPNSTMPRPDVEGGGGKPHEWEWDKVRPWLERQFNRKLPKRFPR